MTLLELRTRLYDNLFEANRPSISNASANGYLNDAMQHVANVMVALDSELLSTSALVTIDNPSQEWYWQALPIVLPWVRHLLRARRENPSSGADPWLERVKASTFRSALKNEMQAFPKVLMLDRRITFLEPEDGVQVLVWYVPELPLMEVDTDTPGQKNGVGVVNIMASHWQPMIPTYAAIMVLASEQVDAGHWRNVFAEQQAAAIASQRSEGEVPARN